MKSRQILASMQSLGFSIAEPDRAMLIGLLREAGGVQGG